MSGLDKRGGQNQARRTGERRPTKVAPVEPSHAPITAARAAAFAILERVAAGTAHSDDLLHGPGMSALSQADRNLATTLVLGVLRWEIALDALVQPLLQRPEPLAVPVAIAIRMGAFQLLHLDRIPAHAALSESVELARAAGHGHAAGMVNAILRKITRLPPARVPLVETTHALAARLAHPQWLVERWQKRYGRADAVAICEADLREPGAGALFAEAEGLPVMDDGSRLVAELAAVAGAAAKRVWDCCAAPGGKTLVLAKRLEEAEVLASDVNPRRLKALAERLKEAAPRVKTLEADAMHLPDEGEFDLILCDVPCSGTGTLSPNPEIKMRLQPVELARQATRQREILTAALGRLAVGGRLVYSTCSLETEENEEVVAAVLGKVKGVREVSMEGAMEGLTRDGVLVEGIGAGRLLRDGRLRTLPGVGFQGDGFFAALLERAE